MEGRRERVEYIGFPEIYSMDFSHSPGGFEKLTYGLKRVKRVDEKIIDEDLRALD